MNLISGFNTIWHQKKGKFQHDWLKNVYLVKLGHFANIIDGHIEDPEFEIIFFESIFPQWGKQREIALWLSSNYEKEVSPRRLLPEIEDQTYKLLVDLVYLLWKKRESVKTLTEDIDKQVAKIDAIYDQINKSRSVSDKFLYTEEGVELFCQFKTSCLELSKAIGKLPLIPRVI